MAPRRPSAGSSSLVLDTHESTNRVVIYIVHTIHFGRPFFFLVSGLFFFLTIQSFYAELGFRIAGVRLLAPGKNALTALPYPARPASLHYTPNVKIVQYK